MSFIDEAIRQWVWVAGEERPEQEWLLSDYDSWHKNPHYTGKPGRHPEDDSEDELPSREIIVGCDDNIAPREKLDDDIPF